MQATVLSVEQVLALQQATEHVPLQLSPDGTHLTLSVQHRRHPVAVGPNRAFLPDGLAKSVQHSRVLVLDTRTGTFVEPFVALDGPSWAAQWSPDGTLLLAYVHLEHATRLALWQRATGMAHLVADTVVRPAFGFEVPCWTPDSQVVVVKLRHQPASADTALNAPPGTADQPRVVVHSLHPSAAADADVAPMPFDWYRGDLGIVEVLTGTTRRLGDDWSFSGWRVAPNGWAAAALIDSGYSNQQDQFYFDLVLIPLDGQPPVTLATRIAQPWGTAFNWSPDSQHIAYLTAEPTQPPALWVVSVSASAPPVNLTVGTDSSLDVSIEAPRWSADSAHIFTLGADAVWACAADGSPPRPLRAPSNWAIVGWCQPPATATIGQRADGTLLMTARNTQTMDMAVVTLDATDGSAAVGATFAQAFADPIFGMDSTPDGHAGYVLTEAAEHPPEIRVWRAQDTPKRLVALNPNLERVALGHSRLVAWQAFDGQRHQGTLLLPAGYQAEQDAVPLIVDVYPGTQGSTFLHMRQG